MTRFKLDNEWTKETVMAQVKKYNNGTKSYRESSGCVYQNDDGNRCAIGCFIPDNHAALRDDCNLGASGLVDKYNDLESIMPFSDLEALEDFQAAHDTAPDDKIYEAIEKFLEEEVA